MTPQQRADHLLDEAKKLGLVSPVTGDGMPSHSMIVDALADAESDGRQSSAGDADQEEIGTANFRDLWERAVVERDQLKREKEESYEQFPCRMTKEAYLGYAAERDRLRKDLCEIAKGCGVGVPDPEEAKRRIIAIAAERDNLRALVVKIAEEAKAGHEAHMVSKKNYSSHFHSVKLLADEAVAEF